jgi:recombination DNA repair RAD52 pathway protein
MMADSGVYEQLARRFAPEDHKLKNGLTYVDGEMVISRLNEELGLEGWSFEVKDVKILENEVWALGRMTVYG